MPQILYSINIALLELKEMEGGHMLNYLFTKKPVQEDIVVLGITR